MVGVRGPGHNGRVSTSTPETISDREAEVLNALGEHLTNAQIAERLYISRRTAEHHVASILSKLDLHSRAEAAAYAVRAASEHG